MSTTACPDSLTLRALLDERLPDDQQAHWAAHLEECAACRKELDQLAGGELDYVEANTDVRHPDELKRVMADLLTTTGVGHQRTHADVSLGFLQPPTADGHIGRFATYNVEKLIGFGGMGIVLLAHDPSLNRQVAIKVLAPQLATQGEARQRFQREAESAAAVESDYVVAIHAVDVADGLPYLVMQYVRGQSLQQRIDRQGSLSADEVMRIGEQIAQGLWAAHQRGLVHRDIKPANILLEEGSDRVKITDFGLAKAVDDASLTRSGVLAGTPQYMAPEQAAGAGYDHRVDLFSLGSVLYAACTGRPPFTGDSTLAIVMKIHEQTPPSIKEINPKIPDSLIETIDQLMAKFPEHRPATAEVVAESLRKLRSASKSPPPDKTSVQTQSVSARKTPIAIVVSIAALLVIVAILFYRPWESNPRTDTADANNQQQQDRRHDEVNAVHDTADTGAVFRINQQDSGHDTLQQALSAAQNGDVIEVHGAGPYTVEPLEIADKSVTIRKAPGSPTPSFRLSEGGQPLFTVQSNVILQGLELRWEGEVAGNLRSRVDELFRGFAIRVDGGTLKAINCTIIADETGGIGVWDGACELVNSLVVSERGHGLLCVAKSPGRVVCRNSILAGNTAIGVIPNVWDTDDPSGEIELDRCTLSAQTLLEIKVPQRRHRRTLMMRDEPSFRVIAKENLLVGDRLLDLARESADTGSSYLRPGALLPFLQRMMTWEGSTNLYQQKMTMIESSGDNPADAPKDLQSWLRLWQQESSGSIAGNITFDSEKPTTDSRHFLPQGVPTPDDATAQKFGADVQRVGHDPANLSVE